ncbi:MAG: MOSC domain-containing protein, partial [Formosimonas sp.]
MSDVTARITELYIYPIKSCAGIRVNEALLTPTGLQYDRHFMLIDENGVMQSQRDHARMALIVPSIDGDRIHIDAPNMPQLSIALNADGAARAVQIWDDVVSGLDMGDDAAAWFSEA